MKNFWKIAGSIVVWAAMAAYLVWAVRQCSARERDLPAAGIEVVVRDSARMQVITPGMVKAWIAAENLIPQGSAASEVPVEKIERLVASRGFVKSAKAYIDMNGVTHVELTQRLPVMRINTSSGYNIYITDDGWVLPVQSWAAMWLPVVTGNYTPPFPADYAGPVKGAPGSSEKKWAQNYLFLRNLINFVGFTQHDDFWNANIEQINIIEPDQSVAQSGVYNPQVEIVPRAGNHIVMLGSLDGYEAKLHKLFAFYREGLSYEGWNTYSYINLSYKGQVVCTK